MDQEPDGARIEVAGRGLLEELVDGAAGVYAFARYDRGATKAANALATATRSSPRSGGVPCTRG